MRFPFPLSLAGLAAIIAFALAGAAYAQQRARPAQAVDARSLRLAVDHYRTITWTFERAARLRRTPTTFSYRRSNDPAYLQWAIDRWTERAYYAGQRALARVHLKLSVALPLAPRLHSRLLARLRYARAVALRLRRIYPGSVSNGFASAHGPTASTTLRLWQQRLAEATLQVLSHGYARPQLEPSLARAFLCIHRYEGAWNANTGNGYYGGLQMDAGFQSRYGADFVRRWGTADRWPVWAQLQAAARAYRSGRGFGPWPNTARACGLF